MLKVSCCLYRSLSLKKCRQLIAKDLGLPENGLDGEKKYVIKLIDEVGPTMPARWNHRPLSTPNSCYLPQIITLVTSNAAEPTSQERKAPALEKRKMADHSGKGKKRQRTGVVKGRSTRAGLPMVC